MELQQVTETKSLPPINITMGKRKTPLKGIIYGDNGAGKTSTLSHSMNPIIFDMEGNCHHIECPKAAIANIKQYNEMLDYLLFEQHEFKSLIVDSLDSLETFLVQEIENSFTKQQLEFQRDAKMLKSSAQDILNKLDKLHRQKGMNILFTAHVDTKSTNNPMGADYDRFDLRIHKSMKTVFCNWAQFICLLQKEPIVEGSGGFGKKKARDVERRVLHTRGTPTYYGKNVFNLPGEIYMGDDPKKGWDELITQINNFYAN